MNNDPVVNTKIKKGKATYAYSIIGVALVLLILVPAEKYSYKHGCMPLCLL